MAIVQHRVHSLAELRDQLREPTSKIIIYHERQDEPIKTDKHIVFGVHQNKVIGINLHPHQISVVLPGIQQILSETNKTLIDVRREESRASGRPTGFGLFDSSKGAYGEMIRYTEPEAIDKILKQIQPEQTQSVTQKGFAAGRSSG